MPRIRIDIDATVLRELKERQKQEGKSLGRLVSELLTTALARDEPGSDVPFRWTTRSMAARVDLDDKDAVRRAVEGA
jgi:hypothetical protein